MQTNFYLPSDPLTYKMTDYCKNEFLKWRLTTAIKAGFTVYQNEFNKLSNVKYSRELAGKFNVRDMFVTYWDIFVANCESKNIKLRESIKINVDKMIHCKDLSKGYLYFECPKCDFFHIQGFSCNSRFCPSCGKRYREERALEMAKTCILTPHRHITWTIPKELRIFFKMYRGLLNELFEAVNDVLTYLIQGKSKAARKRNERLGFISTIHTFGRDIKWNPHIHTLIAECTIDKFGNRKPYKFFNYESLRKSFQNQLLKRIYYYLKKYATKNVINDFSKIRNALYKSCENGFYVHAPKTECKNAKQIKKIVSYVSRYSGHPAISESKITSYNKETQMISYYYDPHEDDAVIYEEDKIGRQYVTEHISKFIGKLIQHIPDESLHQTRYYGFYSNRGNYDLTSVPSLIKDYEITKIKKNMNWRTRLLNTFHYDPLICHCGSEMKLIKEMSYFPRRSENNELQT